MKAKCVVCSPPKAKKDRLSVMGCPQIKIHVSFVDTNAPNLIIIGYKTGKGFEWEIAYSRQRPLRPLHEHVLIRCETV
ncbi:hypothetical protein LguiB_020565 [Lonicera macranthoides]